MSIGHLDLAEPLDFLLGLHEFGQEDVHRTEGQLNRSVDDIQVVKSWIRSEKFENKLHVFDLIASQIQNFECWQFSHLFRELGNLVSSQVQLFEGWKISVAFQSGNVVVGEITLLQLRHTLDKVHVFKFIVDRFENSKIWMTCPTFVYFLKLVERNIKILELWTLKRAKFLELVGVQIQVFEVNKIFFGLENS